MAELFSHVAEFDHFRRAVEQSSLREPVYDLLTGYLARIIVRRLVGACSITPAAGLPPAATARVFAAALVEMMRWWLERGAHPDAQEMDVQFHQIAWGGFARTLPGPA